MRLVPGKRSFDEVFKCHLFFLPTLTKSIFSLHMLEPMQRVMSIEGAEKVVQKFRQQVTPEYPMKLYQSLSRGTEAGILAGEGHRNHVEKKQTIKLTFSVF